MCRMHQTGEKIYFAGFENMDSCVYLLRVANRNSLIWPQLCHHKKLLHGRRRDGKLYLLINIDIVKTLNVAEQESTQSL